MRMVRSRVSADSVRSPPPTPWAVCSIRGTSGSASESCSDSIPWAATVVYTSVVAAPQRHRNLVLIWLCLLTPAGGAPLNSYVDARICAGCHSQIAQNHLQTGMGRSLFRPTPANTVEDYTKNNKFYHPLSDTHYSMILRGTAYY